MHTNAHEQIAAFDREELGTASTAVPPLGGSTKDAGQFPGDESSASDDESPNADPYEDIPF
jgi:hypothetical protein